MTPQIDPLRPCTDSTRALHMIALANMSAQPQPAPCLGDDGLIADPHLAMLLEWRSCRAQWLEMMRVQDDETPESEEVYERRYAIYEAAISKPPSTVSGALAVLAMIHREAVAADDLQSANEEAIRNLILSMCAMVPRDVATKVLAGL